MSASFTLPSLVLAFSVFLCWGCRSGIPERLPEAGMVIESSMRIKPGTYLLGADSSLARGVITIRGENITVDFQGATLMGSPRGTAPDAMQGLAIHVEGGSRVLLKNLRVHGYKVAILADGTDSLQVLDADLSYNYRQRLYSRRDRENLADWLSYHQNDQDEWLRYGAALYLRDCSAPVVRGLSVTGGQNGLMLTRCRGGLLYNNTIQFNSGIGIGLYRSSNNRVMHNRLDYNVRGYSHDVYQRGQDSAGILCYEQSDSNTFAYNSATHSGDGFFLWAGQTTMDTGEGGCNDNLLFANDFSYAPTNGAELTFSRNRVVANRLAGCTYGIWAGYSYDSRFLGNEISDNETGIAIEHGHGNTIAYNDFQNHRQAIRLWERSSQPPDWGFAQARDVGSRDYIIAYNRFRQSEVALQISRTPQVDVFQNAFVDCDERWSGEPPAPSFRDNARTVGTTAPTLPDSMLRDLRPAPLPGGMETGLPDDWPAGRLSILVGEWGPYDYGYPAAWLRRVEGDTYVFLLDGPAGNWKLSGGMGFSRVNPKTGTFPATVTAQLAPGTGPRQIRWTFIGMPFVGPQGDSIAQGRPYTFSFKNTEVLPTWQVDLYDLPQPFDPKTSSVPLFGGEEKEPVRSWQTDTLAYIWWDGPGSDVGPRFASRARATLDLAPGDYELLLTSDEGARVFLDGELLIDDWEAHEPRVRRATFAGADARQLLVEHYNLLGLANLDVQMHRIVAEEEILE